MGVDMDVRLSTDANSASKPNLFHCPVTNTDDVGIHTFPMSAMLAITHNSSEKGTMPISWSSVPCNSDVFVEGVNVRDFEDTGRLWALRSNMV